MSYEGIRERLGRLLEEHEAELSESDKTLLDTLRQLTSLLESDLGQIKVALGHIARLLDRD